MVRMVVEMVMRVVVRNVMRIEVRWLWGGIDNGGVVKVRWFWGVLVMDGWTDERADRWTNKQKLVILESLFLQKNPYSTQFRLYPELDQSLLSYDVVDARKEKKRPDKIRHNQVTYWYSNHCFLPLLSSFIPVWICTLGWE